MVTSLFHFVTFDLNSALVGAGGDKVVRNSVYCDKRKQVMNEKLGGKSMKFKSKFLRAKGSYTLLFSIKKLQIWLNCLL